MEDRKKMTKTQKKNFIIEKVKKELYHLKKDELRMICTDLLGEEIRSSWTKYDLAEIIIKRCDKKKSLYIEVYKSYKSSFGCTVWETHELLGINSYKRRELQKYNILDVAYTYEISLYNKVDVPVYAIDSVLELVGEDIDILLKEARKIARASKNI